MRKYLFFFICTIYLIAILSGCMVTETTYIQKLNVSGPINNVPLHLNPTADTNSIHITPHVTVNSVKKIEGRIEGHSPVDINGNYQVDTIRDSQGYIKLIERDGVNIYDFKGRNLYWEIPNYTISMDLDFKLSQKFAISAGINYSSSNGDGLWGGNIGAGYIIKGESICARLEGGILLQTLKYGAYSAVQIKVTSLFSNSSTTQVEYFRDIKKDTYMNFYGSFTLYTSKLSWPLNFYTQLAFYKQTIADFKPSDYVIPGPLFTYEAVDARSQNSTTFFTVTPGIYCNLNNSIRLVSGIRIAFENGIEDNTGGTMLFPFIQFDVGF
jgi:hypothetical protein